MNIKLSFERSGILLISLLLFLVLHVGCRVVYGASLSQLSNHVETEVAKVNELAAASQLPAATEKLNELNRYLEHTVNFELEEMLATAQQQNPSQQFKLQARLDRRLTYDYWQQRYIRTQKAYQNSREAMSGLASMRTLDTQDVAWAYLKTTYGAVSTIKDVVESVGSQQYLDSIKAAKEGIDDFIENYKQIEEAHLQGLKTDLMEVQMNNLARRAKKTLAAIEPLVSYMKANAEEGKRFNNLLDKINGLSDSITAGKVIKLAFGDPKYTWNYGPFQKEVKEACSDLRSQTITCPGFDGSFKAVQSRARSDWQQVRNNITSSNDEEQKPRFLQWHEENWQDYLSVVTPLYDQTYKEFCTSDPTVAAVTDNTLDTGANTGMVLAGVKSKQVENKTEQNAPAEVELQPEKRPEQEKRVDSQPAEPRLDKKPAVAEKQSRTDKFWNKTIPAGAARQWVRLTDGGKTKYLVRFQVGGRTTGYRAYDDENLRYPSSESVMDNLAVRLGPTRFFHLDEGSGRCYLSNLMFYHENKRVGPNAVFDSSGNVTRLKYYLDGKEVPEEQYKRAQARDSSLVPPDIHRQKKWLELPTDEDLPDSPARLAQSDRDYHQLTIPADAVKFIQAHSSTGGLGYTEYYYSPTTFDELGTRGWSISGGKAQLRVEQVYQGMRGIRRQWNKDGTFKEFRFYYRKDRAPGVPGKYSSVGPLLNGRFRGLDGKELDLPGYSAERAKYPGLPAPGIIAQLSTTAPPIAPGSHPDPDGAVLAGSLMALPDGARLWYLDPVNNFARYYKGHGIVAEMSWYNKEMTRPRTKTLYAAGQETLVVEWNTAGKPSKVLVSGRIHDVYKGVRAYFNPDGSIKTHNTYGGVSDASSAYAGMRDLPAEDAHLSPNIRRDMNTPKIPEAEVTASLKKIWGKEVVSTPTVASTPPLPPQPIEKTSAAESAEEEYERLQKEEMFKLLTEVQQKLDAADVSFNRPYWQDNTTRTTTLKPTNPKQESLDIIRSVLPLIDRAKYPENRGGLYYMVAYKLISYSGRVFSYEAKQEFFQLAAQLVEKSDQLLPQNRYLKQELADAYCSSAEIWLEMTRKAQWGSHAYNKMACDKKVISQFERALQIDPHNQKAKSMLARLKAPKKPVPAPVKELEEIDVQRWNEAQTLMAQLEEGILEREMKPPEINPLEVAELTLSVGSGTVEIKPSGAKEWVPVTENVTFIFSGDMIRTGADARQVSVTFTMDKAFLAIKPEAEVTFVDHSTLLISRAGAFIQVTHTGKDFLVVTPTAGVGVRGTEFEVMVGEDQKTETYLYEGVVETRNGSDIGYLLPGEKMVAIKGQPTLVHSTFDAESRLQTNWGNLSTQRSNHERLRSAGAQPACGTTPVGVRGGSATTQEGSRFTGMMAGSRSNGGQSEKPAQVTFSWSPYGTYSSVMVNDSFNYGTNNLIARMEKSVQQGMDLTITWYYNQHQLSTGRYTVAGAAEFFDGQIITAGEPLNPGQYRVEFLSASKKLAEGSVEIRAVQRLEQQAATQKYFNSLQTMQQALDLVERGDLFNAGISASQILPELRTVLFSAPGLPDIQSVTEMCMALMSFTEMMHATENRQQEQANEWVKRSLGHARRSDQLCQDPQFKVSTREILEALEKIFPEY